MSLFDKTMQELREDTLRLVAVRLEVPDEEACAGAIAEYGDDWRPKASLVLEMEPLSYRLSLRTDGVDENRNEIFRVPITFGSAQNGLTLAELPAIREHQWLGIPSGKLVTLDRNMASIKVSKLFMPYQRFAKRAMEASLHLDVDESTGVPFSNDIGVAFVVEAGYDQFPRGGDETYTKWMNYVVRRAPEDYVAAPLNERDVRFIGPKEEDEAPATVESSSLTAEALGGAMEAAGIVGMRVTDIASPEQQQSITSRALIQAPLLATREVTAATDEGRLIDFAIELGAIDINEEGVIVRA